MSHIQSTSQRVRNKAAIGFGVIGLAAAALSIGLTSAGAAPTAPAKHDDSFSFKLVPSPGIKACMPHVGRQRQDHPRQAQRHDDGVGHRHAEEHRL